MKRSRFVLPETVDLPISNGDTLTVKRRLTWGEQSDAWARMLAEKTDGNGKPTADPLRAFVGTITPYLVDWNLIGFDGRKAEIRGKSLAEIEDILRGLDGDDLMEIKTAIEGHIARVAKEREAEKNGQGGENAAPATSPSPSDAGGASSGSEPSTPTTT